MTDGTTSEHAAGAPLRDDQPSVPEQADGPGRYEIFIDWALRGSEALREHVPVNEEMFVRTHGQGVADARGYFIYAALDECQKAGIQLMRLQELLSGDEISPLADRHSRLVVESIIEEERARERRLVELLVNLIMFSHTNEHEYYRHFFLLAELEDLLWANEDMAEFHGARSLNIDASIQRQVGWIVNHQKYVDRRRAWYLDKNATLIAPGQTDRKRLLRDHVRFSSMRNRIKAAMPLMTPSEKLCTGVSYADAYSASSAAVHYGANPKPYRLQAGQDRAAGTKLGLLAAAILSRAHQILGRPTIPMLDQLARVLDRSDLENGKTLIEQLTNRGLEVGDFVLANGDLAEVLEVRSSKYGNRSYRVLYLAERPLPDVPEDWFPARAVARFFTRVEALEGLDTLWAKHNLPASDLERMLSDPSGIQLALRQSITKLWPMLRLVMRAQATHAPGEPS
jgi:hypothetical protein